MTAQMRPQMAVCPGCVAAPSEAVEEAPTEARLALALPTIHCQGCIPSVGRGLHAHPGFHAARVNLTLKRALIEA